MDRLSVAVAVAVVVVVVVVENDMDDEDVVEKESVEMTGKNTRVHRWKNPQTIAGRENWTIAT